MGQAIEESGRIRKVKSWLSWESSTRGIRAALCSLGVTQLSNCIISPCTPIPFTLHSYFDSVLPDPCWRAPQSVVSAWCSWQLARPSPAPLKSCMQSSHPALDHPFPPRLARSSRRAASQPGARDCFHFIPPRLPILVFLHSHSLAPILYFFLLLQRRLHTIPPSSSPPLSLHPLSHRRLDTA